MNGVTSLSNEISDALCERTNLQGVVVVVVVGRFLIAGDGWFGILSNAEFAFLLCESFPRETRSVSLVVNR